MPSPTSLSIAAALVVIPSSAGIYHLAISSSSSKTVEQEELNKEGQTQELAPAKDLVGPEIDTIQDIEEQPSDTSLDSSLPQDKEPKRKITDIDGAVKHALSDLSEQFPYYQIEAEKGSRTNQFEAFVGTTDSIRQSLVKLLEEFINKEEHTNKDIKTLFQSVLDFELIDSDDESSWSKLAQIRKGEAGAQIDLDRLVNKTQVDPSGDGVTKQSIMDFCQAPTEQNSGLGWYAPTRTEKESTKEYRLFTYYSYCTKNSFYLNDQLVFEEEV